MRSRSLKPFSRSLRRHQTDAEKKLWGLLRSSRLSGVKFRRQLPIGLCVADFCSLERKLVIELDGGQHTEEKDLKRTTFLKNEGFRIVRFWDHEVLKNTESVLEQIRQYVIKSPSP